MCIYIYIAEAAGSGEEMSVSYERGRQRQVDNDWVFRSEKTRLREVSSLGTKARSTVNAGDFCEASVGP